MDASCSASCAPSSFVSVSRSEKEASRFALEHGVVEERRQAAGQRLLDAARRQRAAAVARAAVRGGGGGGGGLGRPVLRVVALEGDGDEELEEVGVRELLAARRERLGRRPLRRSVEGGDDARLAVRVGRDADVARELEELGDAKLEAERHRRRLQALAVVREDEDELRVRPPGAGVGGWCV